MRLDSPEILILCKRPPMRAAAPPPHLVGAGGKRIIELVHRIVGPRAALAATQALVARVGTSTPIVCIEDLE